MWLLSRLDRTGLLTGRWKLNGAARWQSTQQQHVKPVKKTAAPRPQVLSATDIFDDVLRDFEDTKASAGVSLETLPHFGRLLGGLRPGELTVFTGPTGCGKTTVLSQMSMDYALQGVRTLWGSFEVRNSRLARTMLLQLLSGDKESAERFKVKGAAVPDLELLERKRVMFGRLPVNFMNYHGSTPLEHVMDTMWNVLDQSHQQHRLDGSPPLQHVILDNLQFMLAEQHRFALDKFDLSDKTVAALRHFASESGVHVTLVIHPRKEMDDTFLGIASISGTAKATQEADNIIVLQKVNERRYLDLKKNRFSGELGRIEIGFQPDHRIIYEVMPEKDAAPKRG